MKAPESLPRLLGVKEVAWVLGVSPTQVVRLIRAGKLAAAKVSTGKAPRYRVNPAAVAALALDGRAGIVPTPQLAAPGGTAAIRGRLQAACKCA